MRFTLLTALVLATGAVALPAQTNVSFQLKAEGTAYTNGAPVQADFNKDGKPDLAYAGSADPQNFNGLTLRLGNGDGTFQVPVDIGMADSPVETIKTADLDHDGNPDIVALNQGGTFDVFFGNGNGSFAAPVPVVATAGRYMALADFNGDGLLDVAIGEETGKHVLLYNNVGGRTFVPGPAVPVSSTQSVISLAAGNFDNNGIYSLAVMAYGDTLAAGSATYMLWNDGHENFTEVTLATYFYPQQLPIAVVAADANQDGMDDVLASYDCNADNETPGRSDPTPCQGVTAYYGQGQHHLFARQLVAAAGYPVSGNVIAADVNGDGIGDLVTAGIEGFSYSGLLVYLGHPDGSYDQVPQPFIVSSGGVGPVVAGDFNRDGMIDFVGFVDGLETYLNATRRAPCAQSMISPTVTVCNPVEGTYIAGPSALVYANAYDTHGITAMQLYANGSLVYSQNVTTFKQSFNLSNGSNFLVVKAWDDAGINYRSQRHITVYSGTPGATCAAAPNAASICLPDSPGAISPVHIVANGYTTDIPTAAQLYIDGTLVVDDKGCGANNYCPGGTSGVDTTQTLAKGTHNLVFKLWDSVGHTYTAEKSVTVQ